MTKIRRAEVYLSPKEAERFLGELLKQTPALGAMALNAVAEAFRLRPQFLKRQPRKRQAEWMRKVFGRTSSAVIAEELLASYFLDQHSDLIVELLDQLGVEHEEGTLKEEHPPAPTQTTLQETTTQFLGQESSEHRKLLLHAFAAQSAIDWPDLEALL